MEEGKRLLVTRLVFVRPIMQLLCSRIASRFSTEMYEGLQRSVEQQQKSQNKFENYVHFHYFPRVVLN